MVPSFEALDWAWFRRWFLPAFLTFVPVQRLWVHARASSTVSFWGWAWDAFATWITVFSWREAIRQASVPAFKNPREAN